MTTENISNSETIPDIASPRHLFNPPWWRERWDEPETVYFWSGRRGQFEAFSNFAPTPFVMPAWHDPSLVVQFATGEHAFQAAKARTASEHERIRLAASPLEAKHAGRRVALPADWDHRRAHVMFAVIQAKFAVPELRDLLLSTGDRTLAEDSPYDSLWGCRDRSGGYTGQNLLGRALMRVRAELRQTATRHGGLGDEPALHWAALTPMRTCVRPCRPFVPRRRARPRSAVDRGQTHQEDDR